MHGILCKQKCEPIELNSSEMPNLTGVIESKHRPKLTFLRNLLHQCYSGNVTHSSIVDGNETQQQDGPRCPRTFDGFACWDESPASTTAYRPCPEFIVGFDPRRFAYKWCAENGTWYVHPETNRSWTNYTTCVDVDDLNFRNAVNNIYVGGYSISVVALLLSIFIFMYFRSDSEYEIVSEEEREKVDKTKKKTSKKSTSLSSSSVGKRKTSSTNLASTLQCTRIRVHVHLFASFAINHILWIIWYRTVVNNVDVVQDNKVWCQILHIVTHYFMVSNYIWMFCEGLHLHIALVVVFVKDDVAMRWFVMLGWGLSLLIVSFYAVVRFCVPGATERCWMDQSDTFWIITFPVLASLITSLVFLVNVVRVLIKKLHPAPTHRAYLAIWKAARAALILIPLFGLHFILIPLRPSPGAFGEYAYQVASALLNSLQGFCVAVLFCFTNHDVVVAVKSHLSRVFRTNEEIAMTGVTGGESLMNIRENVV